jgi:hypothetical protein
MLDLPKSVLLAAAVLASASSVSAQPIAAQTFEQLQVLVVVGNTVKVIDSAGNRLAGKIAALSGSSLILDVGGTKRTLDERDVLEIRRRGGDSLANGAWWGFGVGAVFGTVGYAVICAAELCSASDIWVIPVYGALGTGIGVGVDALIRGERTIYRAPTRRVTTSVTPIFGRHTGIGVSIAF